MNRRDFSAAAATTLIAGSFAGGIAGPAFAQGNPVEGRQYTKVESPQPPAAPGKVEVLEFFSYACPHCNEFEPTVESWAKRLPGDVAFKRVPVPFLMNSENFMRVYYTLETMGQVDAMQRKVFTAVHVERKFLDKPADIAALMQKNGIDGAKFMDIFNSFSVATSVTRAKKLLAVYRIDSVPTIIVQGRYMTSPAQAGSLEGTVAVVDYLIQQARKG